MNKDSKIIDMANTIRGLKQYLKTLSRSDLINEIDKLTNFFPQVKQHYSIRFNTNNDKKILDKYKKRVKKEFFPDRGLGKARLSIAKEPILEYKRIEPDSYNLADIMLFYVEQGVRFTLEYGDIDEPFYNSVESMYENALKLIDKLKAQKEFYNRCKKVVTDTLDMGWGFNDNLKYLFSNYFKGFNQQVES